MRSSFADLWELSIISYGVICEFDHFSAGDRILAVLCGGIFSDSDSSLVVVQRDFIISRYRNLIIVDLLLLHFGIIFVQWA